MNKKQTVAIIGGGYAGVRVALDLAKNKNVNIILVDKNPYHPLPTQYYELGTFFRKEPNGEKRRELKKVFHDSLYSAALPIKRIFKRYPAVEIIQKEVVRVVPKESFFKTADGEKYSYDWLVVALGSKTNYFGIENLENNSIGLKSPEEALNLRNRIDELFLNSPKNKKIRVVVGGGGFTGSELAGELVGYMKKLAEFHNHPIANWECVIVEASNTVLGTSSPWVQARARKRLQKLGVTLLLEHPIVDVWPNLLHIGPEKRPLPYDVLVWTAGVKGACDGSIIAHATVNAKNCITVDNTLRLMGTPNVFVAGDVAATIDPVSGKPTPMTAQKAIHEGKYVSKSIRSLIKNKHTKLEAYQSKSSSYIIPIGGKYALLETPAVHLSGFFVWCLKYVVLLRYMVSIVPLVPAFRFILKEVTLYTKND